LSTDFSFGIVRTDKVEKLEMDMLELRKILGQGAIEGD
jgi:hypothetical protein